MNLLVMIQRRIVMKLLFVSAVMILASSLICNAQTYRWTDGAGVIHFSDTLESVPPKYRKKMITKPDITIRDPKIMEEMKQQEQRALQEEAARPRIEPTPLTPPPAPAASTPPADSKSEEPPPRTKSQKIRDNIERRRLEEEKTQP
jgi:hypothetical protein